MIDINCSFDCENDAGDFIVANVKNSREKDFAVEITILRNGEGDYRFTVDGPSLIKAVRKCIEV